MFVFVKNLIRPILLRSGDEQVLTVLTPATLKYHQEKKCNDLHKKGKYFICKITKVLLQLSNNRKIPIATVFTFWEFLFLNVQT